MSLNPVSIPLLAALLMAAISAITDCRSGRIPNWLTLPALALAPLAHLLVQGPGALAASLWGLLACGAAPALLHARGAVGGGDVKLFAALGATVGARIGLEIELLSFILAALYALGWLAWEGKLAKTLSNTCWLLLSPLLPASRRRQVRPELMSSVRMGGAVLAATALALYGGLPFWRIG